MWIVSGCLDGSKAESQEKSKSKLLLPGKTYQVTRRYQNENSLVVNSKKVGGDHAIVTVGEHSVDDVENLGMVPLLQFKNSRPKELVYQRSGMKGERIIASKGTEEMKSGDVVSIISGWNLTFEWRPIVVYVPSDIDLESEGVNLDDCARLGIKILWTVGQSTFNKVTHYLTKKLEPNALQTVMLVHNAYLVIPVWLKRIVHLSKLPHVPLSERRDEEEENLSDTFATPLESVFLPPADEGSSLPYPWPKTSRIELFKGYSFTIVSSKAQSSVGTKAVYAALEMVGGRPTTFDVGREDGGKGKGAWAGHLGTALRKVKERLGERSEGGLVLIADEEDLKRICGRDVWEDVFVKNAGSVGLSFVTPGELMEAIVRNDASIVRKITVPSTEVDGADGKEAEKSVEESAVEDPPPRRTLRRRAGSNAPSRASSAVPEEPVPSKEGSEVQDVEETSETQAVRRPLKRRARTGASTLNALLGLDEYTQEEKKSIPVAGSSGEQVSQSGEGDGNVKAEPISQRVIPRSRLKRRAGQQQSQIGNPHLAAIEEELKEFERPTKKLKALFDAADPDRISPIPEILVRQNGAQGTTAVGDDGKEQARADRDGGMEGAVEVRGESQLGTKKRSREAEEEIMDLDAIPEEEAAVEATLVSSSHRARRGRASSRQPASTVGTTPRKRRAFESVNEVETTQIPMPRVSSEEPPIANDEIVLSAQQAGVPRPLKSTVSRIVRSISPDRDDEFIQAIVDLKMQNSKRNKETDKDFAAVRAVENGGEGVEGARGKKMGPVAGGSEGQDWVLLDDMKLDYGIRGNFMRIVEFEVLGKEEMVVAGTRDRGSQGTLRDSSDNAAEGGSNGFGEGRWEGRPNYKAFRKKCSLVIPTKGAPSRPDRRRGKENKVAVRSGKVDLVIHKEPDYGDGSAYWPKNSRVQWQSQPPEHSDAKVYTFTLQGTQAQTQGSGAATQKSAGDKDKGRKKDDDGSEPLFLDSEDEQVLEATLNDVSDLTLKSQLAIRKQSTRRQTAKGKGKGKVVVSDFEGSDIEVNGEDTFDLILDIDQDMDMGSSPAKSKTRKSTKATGASKGKAVKKAKEILLIDDDSDDGMTFGRRKGLRGKR